MRNILTLSNHIYVRLFKSYLGGMLAASVVIQMILLTMKSGLASNRYQQDIFMPYEQLLFNAGIPIIIVLGLISIFVVILCHGLSLRYNHKPIYTLFTLPMPRGHVYIAFFLSGVTLILTFLVVQLLFLFICYLPATTLASEHSMDVKLILENGDKVTGFDSIVRNGLFLSFVRNPVLKILFPYTFWGLLNIVSVVMLLLIVCYIIIFYNNDSKKDLMMIVMYALLFAGLIWWQVELAINGSQHNKNIIHMIQMIECTLFIALGIYFARIKKGGSHS